MVIQLSTCPGDFLNIDVPHFRRPFPQIRQAKSLLLTREARSFIFRVTTVLLNNEKLGIAGAKVTQGRHLFRIGFAVRFIRLWHVHDDIVQFLHFVSVKSFSFFITKQLIGRQSLPVTQKMADRIRHSFGCRRGFPVVQIVLRVEGIDGFFNTVSSGNGMSAIFGRGHFRRHHTTDLMPDGLLKSLR